MGLESGMTRIRNVHIRGFERMERGQERVFSLVLSTIQRVIKSQFWIKEVKMIKI